ncbi:hypothetical protein ABKN59_010860 [Abortiporus biennis]
MTSTIVFSDSLHLPPPREYFAQLPHFVSIPFRRVSMSLFGGGAFGGSTQQSGTTGAFGTFGQPQQQQQQQQPQAGTSTGGGLFGGFNQQGGNTQQTGGGLFGNTNTQPTQTGGLFGSTTNAGQTGTGGGLFGGQQQQQQPAAGTGLFGSTNTQQPATGGGLFGNTQQTQQTQQPAGGGLFGSTTNQPAQQTGTSTGGLFGSTAPSGGGGLFGGGNTSQPGQSVGLFGSANAQNTQTGGGLFGTSTTQPSTGGLFANTGTNAQSTAGGGLFGGFGQQRSGTGSLFGGAQQNQQPQQQQTGSLFGTAQSQPSQQSGGLFGNSNLGTSTLGTSTLVGLGGSTLGASTLLASRSVLRNTMQQQDPQSQFVALTQRIEDIAKAWMPNSPQCRFQHYFYNLVEPSTVHLYGRPANATNDALWQKALRENPDSTCLVPVIACGFDDVRQRVEAQTKQASDQQDRLKDLKTRIEALVTRHQTSNVSRLQKAQILQMQLTHRLLLIIQHLHLLIPTLRSSSIRPEEEDLRAALENIEVEIRGNGAAAGRGGLGKMRGKLNELWALLGAVNAARERDRVNGNVEWAVVDEDGLAQIAQILSDEQAGLAHLTKVLQKNLRDLAIITGVPSKSKEEESNLMTSLRNSAVL